MKWSHGFLFIKSCPHNYCILRLINSTKRVIERKSNDDNSPKIWNEWIKNPWAGVYTIQYDEPVAVKEHFMKDTEESVSIKQFHGGDDDDSSSAGSVPEHLSDFEFSDTESIAEPGNYYHLDITVSCHNNAWRHTT